MQLTKRQRKILVGKVLSDGCLEQNGNFVRLKISHGEKQKDYVFWLYQEFLPLVGRKPYFISPFHKRKKQTYYHWRFATRSLPVFNYWRKFFYKGKKKCIPREISQFLDNPLSLAVWYMDDGFRRRDCRGLYLCTSCFSKEEHILLQNCLRINFGIDTRVHFAAGNTRLYIPAAFAEQFCRIIKPFILPSFSYKLF
jgi:hypothetical protein